MRTAQRQAWLLEAQISDLVSRWNADDALSGLAEPISLDERFDVGEGVQDALSIVSQLSPRLQRIAMLRALGFGYDDIGEITGDSPSRVNRLVSSANSQIREILDERAHATQRSSPRAKRLWELEHDPPKWLVAQIGRPVRPSRKIPGRALRQRAWRRAALALDDYRAAAGEAAFDERGLDEPTEARLRPLHINAAKAVREFAAQRDRERCGHER